MCTSVFLMPIHTYVYIFTYRYIDLDIDIDIHIYIYIYIYLKLCVCIYIYMCMRVWACGCAGCARGCARVGLHLPQGTVAAPNASVCLSRACGGVFRACAVTFHGFGPFDRTSAHRRTAGAGRTRVWCAAGPSSPRR